MKLLYRALCVLLHVQYLNLLPPQYQRFIFVLSQDNTRLSCFIMEKAKSQEDNMNCSRTQVLTKIRLSVQFSRSVVSDSLRPHESQHARPPCPSPTPRVYSNSRPSSRWCHPAISSSVIPFSSCPQSLPASESFPMSQLFAWGGQGIGVSALASFLPKNTQGWSPLERTGWISFGAC